MIDVPYDFSGTVEYQRYSIIVERIKQFDRYYVIGQDQSDEYDMYLIELGNSSKPVMFLTASMHGTEWHATQYGLSFMESLRDNTFPDTEFRNFLLTNFCVVFIPVMNPWGMDRVEREGYDEYDQFDNIARYTSTGTELNGDFYYLTQQESKNVARQINKYQPFSYVDMHMFQTEYNVAYGRKAIIAGAKKETNHIRDRFKQAWESYIGEEITMWINPLSDDSGLARAYAARSDNPHTPYTLAYITEMARPTRLDDGIKTPLSKEEIYK